jgi:hypothetical protein
MLVDGAGIGTAPEPPAGQEGQDGLDLAIT